MKAKVLLLAATVCLLSHGDIWSADPVRGYQAKVRVGAPTRLDWTFAVSNQSVEKPPANWLGDYDSTKQQYDLFVPPNYNAKQAYPAVIFISPGNGAAGWKEWETTAKKEGIIFVAPHAAGNECPIKRRIRIILDVLDDLRRNYNIDPDRTYLTGHSGGGRMTGHIAFALPEYFGGIMPSCAGVELREESWLRHRAIDRLSVAFLTGDGDFNRAECERFRGPLLTEVGVRTKVWVAPKTGHTVPAALIPEAYKWLEEGVAKRRELAKRYPSARAANSANPGRAEAAKLLLDEAKGRLEKAETLYSGLMQMQGVMNRWTGTPAAAEARKTLLEYEGRKEKPWEEEDIAEQRRFLIATARTLDAYASGPLPAQYVKQRSDLAKEALKLWAVILKDGPDTPAGKHARERIPELQKLMEGKGQ